MLSQLTFILHPLSYSRLIYMSNACFKLLCIISSACFKLLFIAYILSSLFQADSTRPIVHNIIELSWNEAAKKLFHQAYPITNHRQTIFNRPNTTIVSNRHLIFNQSNDNERSHWAWIFDSTTEVCLNHTNLYLLPWPPQYYCIYKASFQRCNPYISHGLPSMHWINFLMKILEQAWEPTFWTKIVLVSKIKCLKLSWIFIYFQALLNHYFVPNQLLD